MNAPTKTCSFVVGSKFGPRSLRWMISVSGDDVYVNSENGRKMFHASLHASGRWHIKFHKRPGHNTPKDIVIHRDKVPADKFAVGLHIMIIESDLRRASQVDKLGEPDVWIDRPVYGGAVEISIMTWDYKLPNLLGSDEWPGQSIGTQLHMAYAYPGPHHKTLGLLSRHLPSDDPTVIMATHQRPQIKPIVLNSPERRLWYFGQTIGGALLIIEYAID